MIYVAVFLIPAAVGAVWLCRARIVAEENGLRWRGLGPWRFAPWGDVKDYYERLPQKKSSPKPMVVETAAGRLKFDGSWSNAEDFKERVVRRAISARAKEWGVLGSRPEDEWPRVFEYEPRRTRRTQIATGVMMAAAVFASAWRSPSRLGRDFGTPAFVWDLAGLGLMVLTMGSYAGLVFCVTFRQSQAALSRASQRLVADTSGIALHDKDQTIRFAWPDVTDYYTASVGRRLTLPGRHVVVTPRAALDFLPTIKDARLLKEIVRRYATQAVPDAWKLRGGGETLGGAASLWSGGCVGVGERVFHYRTRTSRALLWFFGFFAFLPLPSALLRHRLDLPIKDDLHLVIGLAVVLAAAFLWCVWRYQAARIQIDAYGITQYAPFGKRFLAWRDVQDFHQSGGDAFVFGNVVGADKRRLRFWLGIADVEELKEEIARSAAHSRRRSWGEQGKQAALPHE